MSDPQYARRASAPTVRMIWKDRLREWSGGLITIVAILAVGASLFAWRYWQVRDAAGAPLQTASAVVAGKNVADKRGRAGNGWDITLQLNGKAVAANTHNLALVSRLSVGDTVLVAYFIGKSGNVYVVDVAETKKQRVELHGLNPVSR